MHVEVTGFDEAIQSLEEIRDSLRPEARCEWALQIEKRARELCGKEIEFHCDAKNKISVTADAEKRTCILRAIKEMIDSMPLGVQAFYQGLIEALEKQ